MSNSKSVSIDKICIGEAAPGCRKVDPILIADGVRRQFGGLTAVDVEHVEIPRGLITALIGPNGAGKTTFFNLLTGFDKPNQGNWSFEGQKLAGMSPYKVARLGMIRTFQLTKALSLLTVIENMRLGAQKQPGESFLTSLIRPLWIRREKEITALMSEPKLIMLDEPMAGVNPALTQSLLDHIKDLKSNGTTVLFVEHDMHMVRHISDWVIVMAEGKVVAEGPPSKVMKDQAVIDAYLGAHHDTDLGTMSKPVTTRSKKGDTK